LTECVRVRPADAAIWIRPVFDEDAFPADSLEAGRFAVPARPFAAFRFGCVGYFAAGSFFTPAVFLGYAAGEVVCGAAF
jgi:hypothetical protein